MARIGLLLTKTPWSDRRQFHRQGPALVEAGHEVVYVAGMPDEVIEHPFTWEVLSDRERTLARVTGGLNLLGRMRSLRCDLLQLCSLELLPLGLALKVFSGTRIVYDCREDIASALRERRDSFPAFLRTALFKAVRMLEAIAARSFDGILTADPAVWELHVGMPKERKHIFYNTALISQFPETYLPLAEREFDLTVLGSMSSLRSGTHHVLDALGILKERGLSPTLLLIGEPEGEVASAIEERVQEYGLVRQIIQTGRIPHAQVAAQLIRAKVGIVPLQDLPKFRRNIACKAFEYMACGMPSIASDLPPQRLFLHSAIASFYPCGDIEALASQIEELLNDPSRCQGMGEVARAEVKSKWNGEREQGKLRLFYAKLLEMPAR